MAINRHERSRTDSDTQPKVPKDSPSSDRRIPVTVVHFGLPILLTLISLVATYFLQPYLFRTPLFFLSIMLATWVGGVGPGILAVMLSTLFISVVLSPQGIVPTSFHDIPNIVAFLITALLVGSWSTKRRRAELALRKAHDELEHKVRERTADLHQLTLTLQAEIKERKQSEAKLKDAEEIAEFGYWERDVMADRIVWSDGTIRIFGLPLTHGVVTQAELQKMIHPADRERQEQALLEALKGSRLYDVEYRIIRPDGNIRFVHVRDEFEYDESGRPMRMFGTVQDITERKQAEEGARRHALQLEKLAEIWRALEEVGMEYQKVLDTVARGSAELIGDGCVIARFSNDGRQSLPVAFHHLDPEKRAIMQDSFSHIQQLLMNTERHQVLLSGHSIFQPDVDPADFRASLEPQLQHLFDTVGVSSIIMVPLRCYGRVIGTIWVTRDRNGSSYIREDELALQDLADRAALKIQNAELFKEVEHARELHEALSRRLLEVQETERRHVARELHDQVGQTLTAIKLSVLSDEHATDIAHARTTRPQTIEAIDRVIEAIRTLSLDLHPSILDDLGLMPALRWYLDRHTQGLQLQAHLTATSTDQRLPSDVEIACFRIFQEATTNIFRHADAKNVSVELMHTDNEFVMTIVDDGRGFVVAHAEREALRGKSLGLLSMRERAANVGGTFDIVSTPGKGTTQTVHIPVHRKGPTA